MLAWCISWVWYYTHCPDKGHFYQFHQAGDHGWTRHTLERAHWQGTSVSVPSTSSSQSSAGCTCGGGMLGLCRQVTLQSPDKAGGLWALLRRRPLNQSQMMQIAPQGGCGWRKRPRGWLLLQCKLLTDRPQLSCLGEGVWCSKRHKTPYNPRIHHWRCISAHPLDVFKEYLLPYIWAEAGLHKSHHSENRH